MWKDLARQSHSDTLRPLRQEEGEFHGEGNRLLVSSVVGQFPLRSFRIEHHVEGKFGETCLDVTCSGRVIAGEDVSPVALAVDKEVLLPHLHKRVLDGGVAMRVELHGMSHDVGHLVVLAVVHPLHGMEDTSLHGLQSVHDMRDSPLENDIRGIVEKPLLVHAREVVSDGVGHLRRVVVRLRRLMVARVIRLVLQFVFVEFFLVFQVVIC